VLELIKETISGISSREAKIHTTREFLHSLVLKILYDKGYFKNLAFVGGTALRFLYDLRRFSEDLDFSLVDREGYAFAAFVEKVIRELTKMGFSLEVKTGATGAVHSAMLKFKDILYSLGLSTEETQKLSIRVELDSNPPKGWNTQISLINRHFVYTVVHFDIPSLYATKLHACFFRRYTKGRDFYDLLWFLAQKVLPNLELLNNAIEQTEHRNLAVDAKNFHDFLRERLAGVDYTKVRKDVERFIEDKSELALLDENLISRLI